MSNASQTLFLVWSPTLPWRLTTQTLTYGLVVFGDGRLLRFSVQHLEGSKREKYTKRKALRWMLLFWKLHIGVWQIFETNSWRESMIDTVHCGQVAEATKVDQTPKDPIYSHYAEWRKIKCGRCGRYIYNRSTCKKPNYCLYLLFKDLFGKYLLVVRWIALYVIF